jgi:cell division protein FtsZ
MSGSKVFIMGTGIAEGDGRALKAVEAALESPLLDSNDIYGTGEILLNITSGIDEITIGEIGEIIEHLQDRAGDDANIIWGNGYDENLGNQISVTIIATGFKKNPSAILQDKEKMPEEKIEFVVENEGLFISDELKDDEPQPDPEMLNNKINEPVPNQKRNRKAQKESWLKRQLDLFFEEKSADLNN